MIIAQVDSNGSTVKRILVPGDITVGEPQSIPIRFPDGTRDDGDNLPGASVTSLVKMADPQLLADATFVSITRPDHSNPALLDESAPAHDLSAPHFYDSGLVPTVQVNGDRVGYARPLRTQKDVNSDDLLPVAYGALTISVHTEGHVLNPVVTVSGKKPYDTTTSLTMTAAVTDPTKTMTYDWNFGDGTTGAGREVPHTYTDEGIYRPAVVVNDPADTSYGRALLSGTVTIGKVRPVETTTSSGGGTVPSATPTTGLKNGSGTRSGGAPTASGSGDQPGTGAGTATPVGPGGAGANASGTGAPNSAAPSPGRSSAASATGAGTLVSGQLLVAPPGAVRAAGPSDTPGQASGAAVRQGGETPLDLRWLGWLVPIALLGLGVFAERRRPRRPSSTP